MKPKNNTLACKKFIAAVSVLLSRISQGRKDFYIKKIADTKTPSEAAKIGEKIFLETSLEGLEE